MITQRLDHKIKDLWETWIEASSEIPCLDTLTFLTNHFRKLEPLNLPTVDKLAVRKVAAPNICKVVYATCSKLRARRTKSIPLTIPDGGIVTL